ncbi:MAG: DUF6714 family protein [Kiloniellales bacterium]|nr:DUF6714 family protein [Kiloniellales bacterium]
MTGKDTEIHTDLTLANLEKAFARGMPPAVLTDSKQLSDFEFEEVMSYDGMVWWEVTFQHIEKYPDAVFWFAPEAFCYYLPGFLAAGLRERRWDSNAYDSLIGSLDRSPEPDYWDDFFLPRWPLLTVEQIDVVADWARWLEIVQPDAYHLNTYDRVQDSLTLLRQKAIQQRH